MDIDDKIAHLSNIAARSLREQKIQKIVKSSHDLDAVITLRVSSSLKYEFNKICKDDQSTISRELKRYMLLVVKQGHL